MTTYLAMAIRLVGLLGMLVNLQLIVHAAATIYTISRDAFASSSIFVGATGFNQTEYFVYAIVQVIAGLGVFVVCLWLMLRPYKLASRWIRAMEGKCPHCLYPRAAEAAGPCSECGLGR